MSRAAPAAALVVFACVSSTSSQYPAGVDPGGDGGAQGGDAGSSGACDTTTTWQVAFGSGAGQSTLTFQVPSADSSGGTWSPTAGFTYTFNASTCTVTLATSGCQGVGSFDLRTRDCKMLTQATCEASTCGSGCPTQPATCILTGL
jgi:hypothetical protein